MVALYGLAGLLLLTAGFGVGCIRARRKAEISDIRHSFVMAGFFLSMGRAMDEGRHDFVSETVRGMARSQVDGWRQLKHRLPESERSKLLEMPIAEIVSDAETAQGLSTQL